MKMREIIDIVESKQVGVVYHFTSGYKACEIIEANKLVPKGEGGISAMGGFFVIDRERNWVSFTRNPNLIATTAAGAAKDRPWGDTRIAFNGDLLAHSHKIEPYHDDDGALSRHDNQAEERVIGEVVNIRKAIIQVDFNADLFIANETDFESWCSPPEDEAKREKYIKMAHDEAAALVQCIRDSGVICNVVSDFKTPARINRTAI